MNTISCQGATLNISPFVSTTYGFGSPYEPYFDRPVYSNRDVEGDFDDDGNSTGDGDVDADYRGEVKAILINHSKEDFTITRGMRIAQMVIAKYEHVQFDEVQSLEETERGTGGFGSTGK